MDVESHKKGNKKEQQQQFNGVGARDARATQNHPVCMLQLLLLLLLLPACAAAAAAEARACVALRRMYTRALYLVFFRFRWLIVLFLD